MQLKGLRFVLLSAAAMVVAGCDGGLLPDGGTCPEGEVMHPTAGICVKTCTAGADCPSEAKTCAALGGTSTDGGTAGDGGTTGTMICQCSTDEICQSALGSNVVCSKLDKVCVTKCSTDSGCGTGRKCNTSTGQCEVSNTTTTCTPACGTGQICDNGTCVAACTVGSCTGGQVCNTTTGVCEAPKTCSTGNAQPDTCNNGQFCSGTSCKDVSAGSCANITAHGASWTPASNGQVIYDVSKVFFKVDTAFCGNSNSERVKVRVLAYAGPNASAFPATEAGLTTMLHYVKADGSEGSIATSVQGYAVTNSNKNAQFDLNFCLPSGSTTFSLGLHFVNGNEVCAQINHD